MNGDQFPLWTWIAVWAAAVLLFLLPVGIAMFAAAMRAVREAGIPRPWFVTMKRLLVRVPLRSSRLPGPNDQVFVAWDLRWMYCGQTTARVAGVDEASGKLELELLSPIPLKDDAGRDLGGMDRVVFLPDDPHRAPYRWAAVTGTLSPPVGEVTATAEIVWYGPHAHDDAIMRRP